MIADIALALFPRPLRATVAAAPDELAVFIVLDYAGQELFAGGWVAGEDGGELVDCWVGIVRHGCGWYVNVSENGGGVRRYMIRSMCGITVCEGGPLYSPQLEASFCPSWNRQAREPWPKSLYGIQLDNRHHTWTWTWDRWVAVFPFRGSRARLALGILLHSYYIKKASPSPCWYFCGDCELWLFICLSAKLGSGNS